MSTLGQPERATQNRVVALFCQELGYRYLGNWQDREKNSNIEGGLFAYLTRRGYPMLQIDKALRELAAEANNPHRSLYDNNLAVYGLLRYGVKVKVEAGRPTETVHLIDWQHPEENDFGIAEEVTLRGRNTRRPDLVLYVNGIALAVIELKNSRISIGDGIRQLLSNQQPMFHADFFSSVQFVFAGSDSEGLKYGTIGTQEKYFLTWKEDEEDNSRLRLDKYLLKMCAKERFLELVHDFVLFDSGYKKVPRVHQYFGIKAAQQQIAAGKGGILWHSQGSGKSIVMVQLAKWILENRPNARVAIITDRDELDKQIQRVFKDAGEEMVRTESGSELMRLLGQARPRLLCSLVHKFGRRRGQGGQGRQSEQEFERFIKDLEAQPSPAVGEIFVFVDECHRTQSGKLHRTMKALLPGATFLGFTGTPLLKADKQTSLEVFGGYIHTYKFSEAVEDKVILDLVYEARDIAQSLGSQERVDAWFEAKTRGLNEWQRAALREQWGTLQNVLSSRSRMDRVVEDIVFDFATKPRLSAERGTAILVAASIYEACKYFELFQKTAFRGKCAVITSYNPQSGDVSREETGANSETDKQFIFGTYTALLEGTSAGGGLTKTEVYEEQAKALFIDKPAEMKLLIVVDKLLTGFDAPSCTYLYIDKSMQDHGLFQAICRTNRLDGEDKEFGYIVDYKDLFKKVEKAIAVYTSELDHSAAGADPEILLQDRLAMGRQRLDASLESLALLCEPVEPPRQELDYQHYFCGNIDFKEQLAEREPRRVALYRGVVALVRAFAAISDELEGAGYGEAEIARIRREVKEYLALREMIRRASGETIDLKSYEADMRHLIDTYIEASQPRTISPFEGMPLLELLVKSGIAAAIAELPAGLRASPQAVAETIANNVRSKILKEHLNDPAYYDRMSKLLDEIIADLRSRRIEYEEYLKRIAALAKQVQESREDALPAGLDTAGKLAIFNNLEKEGEQRLDPQARRELALAIDETVRRVRPDDWRGHKTRENEIKSALLPLLESQEEVERLFAILQQHREY